MEHTAPVVRRMCLAVLCFGIIAHLVETRIATGKGATGKEFMFGILDFMGEDTWKDWAVHIHVGAKTGGHFYVYCSATQHNGSYYINPRGRVSEMLNDCVKLKDGTYIGTNAVQISSNTELSVVVTVSNPYLATPSASSYVIYPTSMTNYSYYAASYVPVSVNDYASRVMAVALYDSTEVTLTVDGNNMTAMLDRMDVFQYDSPGYKDLTGCKIYSHNTHFVVLSGSSASRLPGNLSVVSPIAAQMLPYSSYRFIVPSFEKSESVFVRVLTEQPYNITIINKTSIVTYTTKGLQTYMLGTEPTSILTSVGVSLVLYNSPFMSVIPGVNQYLNEYSFIVPTLYGVIDVHYKLVAIVPSGGATGLLLDGDVFTGTAKHIMSVNDEYTILTGNVTNGFHYIVNVNPDIEFGLLVYNQHIGFFVGMSEG